MQNKARRLVGTALLIVGAAAILAGCSQPGAVPSLQVTQPVPARPSTPETPAVTPAEPKPAPAEPNAPAKTPAAKGELVANPTAINVLVNKRFMLPADYRPADLVEPNVPYIFAEKAEKRLMRQEAAHALESLFAAAKKDGIFLAGVSGYRSYATQKWLFEYYVQAQGEEVARQFSAEPGHSEHQTGLAMDVSGSTGECAADTCFAGTPEAVWLAAHAAEHGFIIRYPQGKEQITGYSYEPWHLRCLGTALSREIAARGVTMEEYMGLAR